MNKAILFAAAFALAPLSALGQQGQQPQQSQDQSQDRNQDRNPAYSDRDASRDQGGGDLLERLSRSDLRDRIATAAQRVEDACGDDIQHFCGDVTPGQGRIASCVQAYSDQLSRRCQVTLSRTVERVQQAVENIADTCMSAVQQQCGDNSNIRQCLQQKSAALPHPCQTIVAVLQHAGQAMAPGEFQAEPAAGQGQGTTQPQGTIQAQGEQPQGGQAQAGLKGMPVFASDGKNVGQIVQIERAPDGKIQSAQIQVGRLLGLGERTITVDGSKLERLADRIRLTMSSDQVRSLPEAKPGNAQR